MKLFALLFVVAGCRDAEIVRAPTTTEAPAARWQIVTSEATLTPLDWKTAQVTVPNGAERLSVELSLTGGDVDLVVARQGDEEAACREVGWDGLICEVEDPAPGLWTIDLTSTDGADAAGLIITTEGDPAETFLLGRLDMDFGHDLIVDVPDALGELTAELRGSQPKITPDTASCNGNACSLLFPAPGPVGVECTGGADLQVFWNPARRLFEGDVNGSEEFAVERAYDRIEARGPAGQVALLHGGEVVCQGERGCSVDAPATGGWTVRSAVPGEVIVGGSVTMLAAPPSPPDVVEQVPEDQGNDRFSAQVVSDFTTIDAELTTRDQDWFLLQIRGPVRVLTYGPTDTIGTAYDARGEELVSDDDSGVDQNFTLEVDDGYGVWIQVTGFGANTEGRYSLVIGRP